MSDIYRPDQRSLYETLIQDLSNLAYVFCNLSTSENNAIYRKLNKYADFLTPEKNESIYDKKGNSRNR